MKENELVIFETEDSVIKLTVPIEDETVWLTQAQMTELFERDVSTISRHITNIFSTNEVDKKAICIFCKLQIQINLLRIIH